MMKQVVFKRRGACRPSFETPRESAAPQSLTEKES
jgi:hypothetical protein